MDTTKVFNAPILLGPPTMCTLSLTVPVVMCSCMNTCHGKKVEREESWLNPSSAICEAKRRYEIDVWEKGGKKISLL